LIFKVFLFTAKASKEMIEKIEIQKLAKLSMVNIYFVNF
jgi:hypothetical protein